MRDITSLAFYFGVLQRPSVWKIVRKIEKLPTFDGKLSIRLGNPDFRGDGVRPLTFVPCHISDVMGGRFVL